MQTIKVTNLIKYNETCVKPSLVRGIQSNLITGSHLITFGDILITNMNGWTDYLTMHSAYFYIGVEHMDTI